MFSFPHRCLRGIIALGVLLTVSLIAPHPASADRFEKLSTREILVPDEMVDLTVADDGSYTFVLTTGGKVVIYDATGRKVQIMDVGSGYDRLEYDQKGNRLVLGGSGQKKFKVISLEMRFEIDPKGSPYRGMENAPVTIAVFSDFQ